MTECEEIIKTFGGTWETTETNNVDKFLEEMGIGLIKRKAANHAKPTLVISIENNEIKLVTRTFINTTTRTFTPGVQKEITDDGKKYQITLTCVNGVLKTENEPVDSNTKASCVERKVDGDFMMQTMICNGVIANIKYKRAE